MSNLLILAPLPIAAVTGDGTDPANLLTVDPREVWTSDGDAIVQLTVDLGAAMTFDTVFLGYVQPARAAFIGVSVDGGATTLTGLALPRRAGRAAHGLFALAAPVTGRTILLTLNFGSAGAVTAGVVMVGKAFRPTWPQELGAGRAPIDTGTRTRLQGGGFGIDPGVVKSSWQWTLGDLGDDELAALYDLVCDRGETAPVLLVEAPDATAGLCERIHYAAFDRLEAYERRDVGLTRWGLRVEDWL